jgi:hypothetical protein
MAESALASLPDRRASPPHVGRRAEREAAPAVRREPSRLAHRAPRPLKRLVPAAFAVVLAAALVAGWLNREEEYLVPGSGAGYWLGIAGASLMLLLLLYPLRKRMRLGRVIGSVAFWFRLHMVLGLVGPALIVFHANFKFGSFNSNVAMVAMLTVAGSGIVGRYLYGKIHLGLYGRKAVVQELLVEAAALERSLGAELPGCDRIVAQMHAFADRAFAMRTGLLLGLFTLPALGLQAWFVRRRLRREAARIVRSEGKRRGWPRRLRAERLAAIVDLLRLYFAGVRQAAAFAFYDRLFGLWHLLHLPLFIILILAASIHVVAAHLF